MRYRELGTSGIQASVVGFGAWALGGWRWGGQEERDSIRALHAALDKGINLIDTAPVYGFGRSEEVVGKAIAGRRDEVVLATKCGITWKEEEPRRGIYHFSADEFGMATREKASYHLYRYLGGNSIRNEVEESLRRLKVDVIDLVQTHWQDSTTPVQETMETLLDLKQQGKIRAIGVSNASPLEMEAYLQFGTLDADQERYSMLDRQLEQETVPFCRKHRIAILAYSPLANGLLTGKIGLDRRFKRGDLRESGPRFSIENRRKVSQLLEAIRPLADAHQVSLAQLVIAWTVAQPGLTHALTGIRNQVQAESNAIAADLEWSGEELRVIDRALDRYGPAIC